MSICKRDRGEFARALDDSGGALTVASAWELPEEDRAKIIEAVHEHVARDAEVRFEVASEMTCGIELRAFGREISWTIEGYVQDIRDALAAAVDERLKAEAEAAEPDSESPQKPTPPAAEKENETEQAEKPKETPESGDVSR